MKKLTFLLIVLCAAAGLQARTVDLTASYTGASHFSQAALSASTALTLDTFLGFIRNIIIIFAIK